jgi:hypothetical protein
MSESGFRVTKEYVLDQLYSMEAYLHMPPAAKEEQKKILGRRSVAQAKWNLLGICIFWELHIDTFSNMAWWMAILLEMMNKMVAGGSKFMAFHLICFWS